MAFVPFVESDQPTMAAFNEKFQQNYDAAVAAGLKIKVGSYTGTGMAGSSNQNKLSFGFKPQFLFVTRETSKTGATYGYYFTAVRGVKSAMSVRSLGGDSSLAGQVTLTWGDADISFYGYDAEDQLNAANTTYYYFAIGF